MGSDVRMDKCQGREKYPNVKVKKNKLNCSRLPFVSYAHDQIRAAQSPVRESTEAWRGGVSCDVASASSHRHGILQRRFWTSTIEGRGGNLS
jgi:hypothetical protein